MSDLLDLFFAKESQGSLFLRIPPQRGMILIIPGQGTSFQDALFSILPLGPMGMEPEVISRVSRKDILRAYHDGTERLKRES